MVDKYVEDFGCVRVLSRGILFDTVGVKIYFQQRNLTAMKRCTTKQNKCRDDNNNDDKGCFSFVARTMLRLLPVLTDRETPTCNGATTTGGLYHLVW